MPSLISDNRGQKYVDVMAALQTADVAAATPSQTMYSVLSKTNDSDVEQDMGAEAAQLDIDLAASYALLGAKFDVALRGWRVPRILGDLLTDPMTLAASNVFPVETDLGAFVYGGSYVADTALVLGVRGTSAGRRRGY